MKLIGWIQIKTKIGFFFFFPSIPFLGLAPVKGSDAGLVNCISDNNLNKDRVKFKILARRDCMQKYKTLLSLFLISVE